MQSLSRKLVPGSPGVCCYWGLRAIRKESYIPLKSLDISVIIINNVARVFYTQVYFNDAKSLLETEFFFPITPDACFDSFEARFKDTTIKGVIKEKEKAKEEYKQGIQQGKTVAYSEINEETNDVMKVMIGNIPPSTPITITYSYIQKLETSLNKFWCFRLFSTLTPRYNGNLVDYLQTDVQKLANYPTISNTNPDAYLWSVKVDIQSPSPLTLLRSPSHNIITTFGNERHTCTVNFRPADFNLPNKDFVLLYSNGRENMMDYTMTPFEDGYCAMLTYLADFDDKNTTEDAYKNFETAKEPAKKHEMNAIRGEYIFLLDRSGSMRGDRITMAKNSLNLFLRSLPKDSYMNVVSFGYSYELLYHESVYYSQQSLTNITNQVQGFQANMGGTEIYQALQGVYNLPQKKGYPRFIFLLTDGDISNTNQVIDLINRNSDRARVFTIGVGNGCSPELVTKAALYGRGKHEFVGDNNQIYEKVISLLDASMSPSYSDLSLSGDNFDALVKSVSPNPADVPFLLNGQPITFFLLLRKEGFADGQKMNFKLRMYDSRLKDYRTVEIALDAAEALENDMLPKLAIHDMIQRLEAQKDGLTSNQQPLLWADKVEIKKTLIEYSLKYGVLSKETAFFCEVDKGVNQDKTLHHVKVIVPNILSQDHSNGLRNKNQFLATSSQIKRESFVSKPALMMKKGIALTSDLQTSAIKSSTSLQSHRIDGASFNTKMDGMDNFKGSVDVFKNSMRGSAMKSKAVSKPQAFGSVSSLESKSKLLRREERDNEMISSLFSISSTSISNTTGASYLDVIMKQTFEGSWDPQDKELISNILKGSQSIPSVPEQITALGISSIEAVWMTILVLVWLEVVCGKDKQAWRFIHQKGCDWLQNKGINYEEIKQLANQIIQA